MNRLQLRAVLDREGVSRTSYSLDGGPSNARYAIDLNGLGWRVSHRESEALVEQKAFGSEDRACSYLLDMLLRDTSTRALLPGQQDRRSEPRLATETVG